MVMYFLGGDEGQDRKKKISWTFVDVMSNCVDPNNGSLWKVTLETYQI